MAIPLTAAAFAKAFSEDELEVVLFQYICDVLTVSFPLKVNYFTENEEFFLDWLVNPLQHFLFDGQSLEEFAEQFERRNQQKPTKCGKVFGNGEPHYSCRECSVDPTCVLCGDCFQASEHKNHRYRIGTSSGGGCCDCGDEEAWKIHYYCSLHEPQQSEGDCVTELPVEMGQRVRKVFDLIVFYFNHYLNIHATEFHRSPLKLVSPDLFATVLYNDELHTFDQVIEALKKALKCDNSTAKTYASLVDREGRHAILLGDKAKCEETKDKVDKVIQKASVTLSRRKPIHMLVLNVQLFSFQIVAQRLLKFLAEAVSRLAQLRRIFCDLLLHKSRPDSLTLLEYSLLHDTTLWKSVRSDWHGILIKSFLIDYDHKKQFAFCFMKHYDKILQDYYRDEHHHAFSVSSMTVQIFTVPSIAKFLVFECDALTTVFTTFIQSCTAPKGSGHFKFDLAQLKVKFIKYGYCINHVEYLLHTIPESWTDECRNKFLAAFGLYAELMSAMENLIAVKREVKHHIEVEPEWEPAMRLQLAFGRIHAQMLDWAASDAVVLENCLRLVLNIIQRQGRVLCEEEKTFFGIQTRCISNPVEVKEVSVHLQLNRLFAALMAKALRLFSEEDPDWLAKVNIEVLGPCAADPVRLMEPCLRVIVLAAQVVYANMWRRNGYSLLNQIHLYHRVSGRIHMYNKDIAMLQICACLTSKSSVDHFLISLLNKFHLKMLDWFEPRQESKVALEDLSKTYLALIEEFLYLLIVMLSERHSILARSANRDLEIQYELLHILMLGVTSHSEIVKKVSLTEDVQQIDDNLGEVATFSVQRKKFEVKQEAVEKLFNPMCYHLSRSELASIESSLVKEKKQRNEPEYIAPPKLTELNPALRSILNILDSEVLFFIIHSLLRRALYMSERFYSENIVHFCVYLIALGLNEELWFLENMSASQQMDQDVPSMDFARKCFQFGCPSAKNPECKTGETIAYYLTELLNTDGRVDNYKALIQYVLDFRDSISALKNPTAVRTDRESMDQPDMSQKSSIKVSDSNIQTTAERNRKRQRDLAKKTRELALQQMQNARQAFSAKHNSELNEIAATDIREPLELTRLQSSIVLLGEKCSEVLNAQDNSELCLVCKTEEIQTVSGGSSSRRDASPSSSTVATPQSSEEAASVDSSVSVEMDGTDQLMVQIVFIQKTRLFSQNRADEVLSGDDIQVEQMSPPPSTCAWGSLMSSCGHNLHYGCWQRYFKNLVREEQNRQGIRRLAGGKALGYNLEKGEFLCPMCGALGNATVPLIQSEVVENLSKSLEDTVDSESLDSASAYFETLYEFTNFGGTRSNTMTDITLFEKMTSKSGMNKTDSLEVPESLNKLVNHFAESVYIKGLEVNPDENNPRIPVVFWNTLATTVVVQEYGYRSTQKPLFASSSRQEGLLDSLCRNMVLMPKLSCKYLNLCKEHMIDMFRKMFINFDPERMLYDHNLFYYMVYLTSSLHLLLENGPNQVVLPMANLFMRKRIYLFMLTHFVNLHVVQVLLKLARDIASKHSALDSDVDGMFSSSVDGQQVTELTLLDVFNLLVSRTHFKLPPNSLTLSCLLSRLEVCLVPWLRCCALFFKSFLMAGPVPKQLEDDDNNLELLCQYLGLPQSLETLLKPLEMSLIQNTHLSPFVLRMCEAAGCRYPSVPIAYPLEPMQLINLPRDYTDLINQPIKLCPTTNNVMRYPAICMVCGEVICSGSYCCQLEDSETNQIKGASMQHVEKCTGSSGMFLRPLECKIMLISSGGKGCFFSAPYVDEYGETDAGLKRGNPMYLNEEKLEHFRIMWLSQKISDTVSRHLSRSNFSMWAFDWNEM